jgi:hypothetical protein
MIPFFIAKTNAFKDIDNAKIEVMLKWTCCDGAHEPREPILLLVPQLGTAPFSLLCHYDITCIKPIASRPSRK